MNTSSCFGQLVLILLACGSGPSAGAQQPNSRIKRDLIYTTHGRVELKLDLILPAEGKGPFPVVVCIHGGGWYQGQRQDMEPMAELFARRGYAAATISYRLAPVRFPAQIEDCKAAVRWLRANAWKHNLNPNKIGVIGPSAGGHLSCLLGVTGPNDGLEGTGGNPEQSSGVQAVVSFFGRMDFTKKTWDDKLEEKIFVPLLGATLKDQPDRYRVISPVSYVTKDAPPFLLLHGSEDQLVPPQDSIAMAKKLQQVGSPAKVVVVQGVGHGSGDWIETWGKQVQQAVDFFDEHLKK